MESFLSSPYFFLSIFLVNLLVVILFSSFIYIKLKNEIIKSKKELENSLKLSVEPKFLQFSQDLDDIASLAIEVWRIKSKISKLSADLPDNKKRGIDSSVDKFVHYLNQHDIEILDYTGVRYNEGLNLDVLDVRDGIDIENTVVAETIEPAIVFKGNMIKKAKIIL
jgi:hypothetical protein